jgi:CRISPR-associated protein Csm5
MEKIADYIKVRLHVMSPLHIGCDEVYEPISFVIDEDTKKLIEFEPVNFIKALTDDDRKRFSEICMSDSSILQIYKYVRQKYKKDMGGRAIDIAGGLVIHYKKVLSLSTFDKKAVINNFTIQRTAYNPHDNMPYIPGSSVKGALRTGYLSILATCGGNLSELAKSLDDINYRPSNPVKGARNARALEEQLLGGVFSSDPFSHVKVSDFLPAENVRTKILYAVNRKKKASDRATAADSGPAQIFETISSGSIFEGQITIKKPLNGTIKYPITSSKLLLSVHRHYAGNLSQENAALKRIGIKRQVGINVNEQFEPKLKKDAYLFRLGRHSGAEAVTIEGNRKIKIMRGRGRYGSHDHATTFWLAAEEPRPKSNTGLVPFGWAVLEIA